MAAIDSRMVLDSLVSIHHALSSASYTFDRTHGASHKNILHPRMGFRDRAPTFGSIRISQLVFEPFLRSCVPQFIDIVQSKARLQGQL